MRVAEVTPQHPAEIMKNECELQITSAAVRIVQGGSSAIIAILGTPIQFPSLEPYMPILIGCH